MHARCRFYCGADPCMEQTKKRQSLSCKCTLKSIQRPLIPNWLKYILCVKFVFLVCHTFCTYWERWSRFWTHRFPEKPLTSVSMQKRLGVQLGVYNECLHLYLQDSNSRDLGWCSSSPARWTHTTEHAGFTPWAQRGMIGSGLRVGESPPEPC